MTRYFMSKENRDRAWREGGRRGVRSITRNQELHPQYVADYAKVTGNSLTGSDCGLGNAIYKTHFSVLYRLEPPRFW